MWRLIFSATLIVLTMSFFQTAGAYVFLGAHKPRLQTQDGSSFYFHLTPQTPRFVDKENFEDGIYADSSDTETFSLLVGRAMDVWNEIPGLGIELKVAEEYSGKIDDSDNKFSIGVAEISTVASGLAYPVSDESDPTKIRDCDIQVGTDVTSIPVFIFVMIHELGHCLGLGHNHSDPSAIMGYWQPRGVIQLGLDDMAGVLSLYPQRSGERTRAFAPCGSLASTQTRIVGLNRGRGSAGENRRPLPEWLLVLVMVGAPLSVWLGRIFRPWSSRRRPQRFVR